MMPCLFKIHFFDWRRRWGKKPAVTPPQPLPDSTPVKTANINGPKTTINPPPPTQTHSPPAPPDPPPTTTTTTPSRLEALPPELRRHILSLLPTLSALEALVRASPVFHAQYRLDRRLLLGRVLAATLGGALPDACAVHTSAPLRAAAAGPLDEETVARVMEGYVGMRGLRGDGGGGGGGGGEEDGGGGGSGGGGGGGDDDDVGDGILAAAGITEVEELVAMARFQQRVVDPLLEACAATFLRRLRKPRTHVSLRAGDDKDVGLSPTEQARLVRALYRFEMCCNLPGIGPRNYRTWDDFMNQTNVPLGVRVWAEWEVEELDSVYALIRDKYEAHLNAVQDAVRARDPVSKERDYSDMGPSTFELTGGAYRDALKPGTASRGLGLFLRLLQTGTHEGPTRRMRDNIPPYRCFWDALLEGRFIEGNRAEACKDKCLFSGDDQHAPPLAWVIAAHRTEYCMMNHGRCESVLDAWGYVFWDSARLMKLGTNDDLVSYGRRRWRKRFELRERGISREPYYAGDYPCYYAERC